MFLLPAEYQIGYNKILTNNLKRIFEVTLNHFYNKYGQEDKVEIEENKETMKKQWHPREAFQVLKQQISDGHCIHHFIKK